jgi:hypothetical protein
MTAAVPLPDQDLADIRHRHEQTTNPQWRARNDVGRLLAEVDRLRAENARLRTLLTESHHAAYHQGEPRDNHVRCRREGCGGTGELYPPADDCGCQSATHPGHYPSCPTRTTAGSAPTN